MIVVDTNVIFHFFNETELTSFAQKVFDKDPLWITSYTWKYEFANILSKLIRKEKSETSEVINFFEKIMNEIKTCERNVSITLALELSIIYQISVYDAYFLVLAKEYETFLITEDKELLKKCPRDCLSMQYFIKL